MMAASYAWYTFSGGSTSFSTTTYNEYVDVSYEDNSYINIGNAIPILESEVDEKASYNNFSVSVVGEDVYEVLISISLVNISMAKELLSTDFKYQLLDGNTVIKEGTSLDFLGGTSLNSVGSTFTSNKYEILSAIKLDSTDTYDYAFRVWINDNGVQNDLQNKTFTASIEVNAIKIRLVQE